MAPIKTYTVRFERDETGQWIATIPAVRGCHSYGRTLEEAKRRIREALSLFKNGAAKALFKDDVRLAPKLARLRKGALAARERADQAHAKASTATRRAAKALTRVHRLSVRDTGRLLGVSHQRVHQLLDEKS